MGFEVDWSPLKNDELRSRYGIGFERLVVALSEGKLLDERRHPNVDRFGHQRQLVVEIESYAWVVPYIVDGDRAFLKTLFPSRKDTARYLGRTQ